MKSVLNFVISLNIPLQKLFRWFRRLQLWATNWWLADSSHLLMYHMSCRVFSWNIKLPRWFSPHYSPYLVPCDFWIFPKLKSLLKEKKFQTIDENQENMMGQLMETGRTVWGAYFEEDWGVIVLCTMFLVSCIFFNKCLYFSYYMAGYFLDRPCLLSVLWEEIQWWQYLINRKCPMAGGRKPPQWWVFSAIKLYCI